MKAIHSHTGYFVRRYLSPFIGLLARQSRQGGILNMLPVLDRSRDSWNGRVYSLLLFASLSDTGELVTDCCSQLAEDAKKICSLRRILC